VKAPGFRAQRPIGGAFAAGQHAQKGGGIAAENLNANQRMMRPVDDTGAGTQISSSVWGGVVACESTVTRLFIGEGWGTGRIHSPGHATASSIVIREEETGWRAVAATLPGLTGLLQHAGAVPADRSLVGLANAEGFCSVRESI